MPAGSRQPTRLRPCRRRLGRRTHRHIAAPASIPLHLTATRPRGQQHQRRAPLTLIVGHGSGGATHQPAPAAALVADRLRSLQLCPCCGDASAAAAPQRQGAPASASSAASARFRHLQAPRFTSPGAWGRGGAGEKGGDAAGGGLISSFGLLTYLSNGSRHLNRVRMPAPAESGGLAVVAGAGGVNVLTWAAPSSTTRPSTRTPPSGRRRLGARRRQRPGRRQSRVVDRRWPRSLRQHHPRTPPTAAWAAPARPASTVGVAVST